MYCLSRPLISAPINYISLTASNAVDYQLSFLDSIHHFIIGGSTDGRVLNIHYWYISPFIKTGTIHLKMIVNDFPELNISQLFLKECHDIVITIILKLVLKWSMKAAVLKR